MEKHSVVTKTCLAAGFIFNAKKRRCNAPPVGATGFEPATS